MELNVTMFNEFTITYQNITINMSKYLGKQLLNLLQILICNAHQPVKKDTLIDIICPESENPNSVIKFTVFRLRKDIQKIPFFEGVDLILTTKQGYQLNPEIKWNTDFMEFNQLWEDIKFLDNLDNGNMKKALRIIELYKGKFYVTNSNLMWAIQICEYYRQSYVKCVIKVCKRLLEDQKYDEMMSLNYQAILLEPFYEGLHYYYMKGLLETSDYHKALRYYDDLNEAFVRELGTGLSDRFKDLYNSIMKDHEDINRLEITNLIKELSVRTQKEGGFYCAFDMFKYMYELLVKTGKREGKNLFLISFEVINEKNNEAEVYGIVNKVKQIIASSLRNNDLFTKVSDGQFVVLVTCHNIENSYLIIQRISNKFYRKFRGKAFRLNYNVAKAVLLEDIEKN